jgi:hypothetical protein
MTVSQLDSDHIKKMPAANYYIDDILVNLSMDAPPVTANVALL